MKGDKLETVKAVALQSGVQFLPNGLTKAFKEKDVLNWDADDAPRSERTGVIQIVTEPAPAKK